MTNLLIPTWPAPSNVKAFTTLRSNDQNFALINNPSRQQNIKKLCMTTGLPNEPYWLKQVHGKEVVSANILANYNYNYNYNLPIADASYTLEKNIVCVVLTADCLPILLCDKNGSQVAAIHAGWKGLAAGIIESTVKKLTLPKNQYLVWLGPAISKVAFIVGEEVYNAFADYPKAFKTIDNNSQYNKWLADLYLLAKIRLQQTGILSNHIYGGEWCTFSDQERFYSYRRSQDQARMATVIYLN